MPHELQQALTRADTATVTPVAAEVKAAVQEDEPVLTESIRTRMPPMVEKVPEPTALLEADNTQPIPVAKPVVATTVQQQEAAGDVPEVTMIVASEEREVWTPFDATVTTPDYSLLNMAEDTPAQEDATETPQYEPTDSEETLWGLDELLHTKPETNPLVNLVEVLESYLDQSIVEDKIEPIEVPGLEQAEPIATRIAEVLERLESLDGPVHVETVREELEQLCTQLLELTSVEFTDDDVKLIVQTLLYRYATAQPTPAHKQSQEFRDISELGTHEQKVLQQFLHLLHQISILSIAARSFLGRLALNTESGLSPAMA